MLETAKEFLSGSVYYDLPSFEVALFSLLLGFVLSSAIALTYRVTFRGKVFPNHFFQAMILSSLVTGMIMMAVGNNFAVGFGIIGAVAVIRFRTVISDPRNIIFMFAAISIGIATGVKGYPIAVAGTALFCLISLLLYWSPFGSIQNRYRVVVRGSGDSNVKQLLDEHCDKTSYKSSRSTSEKQVRLEVLVELSSEEARKELFSKLKALEGVEEFRIESLATSEDQL